MHEELEYYWYYHIHMSYVFIIWFLSKFNFFMLWFSQIFYCLKAVFVPRPADKLMVPNLTNRDCEYCSWFPLHKHDKLSYQGSSWVWAQTTLYCNVVSHWLSPYPEPLTKNHTKTRQNTTKYMKYSRGLLYACAKYVIMDLYNGLLLLCRV